MTTLAQALESRLNQANLVGWILNKRRWIKPQKDGIHAILHLGWSNPSNTLQPADGMPAQIGDHVVTLDIEAMPKGVCAFEWWALPDTEDLIRMPAISEIKSAARSLGNTHVDKIQGDGILTYCLVSP